MENNVPCIEEKCLLYPACLSRKAIECTELFNWLVKEGQTPEVLDRRWGNIKHYLKKVTEITTDHPSGIIANEW